MVVNLDEHHTMKDVEKLAAHFNQKYGWQCYQIAIHRDEGHLVSKETGKTYRSSKKGKDKGDFKYNAKTGIYTFKNGDKYTLTELKEKFEIKINYHAHLELFTVNKQGITAFKKAQFAKKAMSQIQTEVAELLGMERGEYKNKSKCRAAKKT